MAAFDLGTTHGRRVMDLRPTRRSNRSSKVSARRWRGSKSPGTIVSSGFCRQRRTLDSDPVPLDPKVKQSVAQVRIDGVRDRLPKVEIRQPDGDRSLMTLRPPRRHDESWRAAHSCLAGLLVFAAIVVARAHYITDLSAFLPANPTPEQQLLVDQLRDGPASRLILVAIERGDSATRARISIDMADRLRKDPHSPRSTTAPRSPDSVIASFFFSTGIC